MNFCFFDSYRISWRELNLSLTRLFFNENAENGRFHTLYFMAPGWDNSIEIVSHSAHAGRDHFNFEVETYREWCFLAAEVGHFWYRIGQGNTAIEGLCHPGEWVICPPSLAFRRRVLAPLNFQFARLNFSAAPALQGKITPHDLIRARTTLAALRASSLQADASVWKEHLLLDLLRSALWGKSGLPQVARQHDAEIERVAAWLETHLEQKIAFSAVAASVRLSPVALTRRFRAATGQTPSEFLLQKRLERARTFLLEGDSTLEFIAASCGFGNGFYFSRMWTKRIGGSPSRFRRENQV